VVFVVIKLYNKASGCSIPFGKEHPLFSFFRAKLMTQLLSLYAAWGTV